MAAGEWRIVPGDTGVRLDKWLAAPDRLGSRGRAARALVRGQVFVNGVEQQAQDAARPLAEGDAVRVWVDRPGSAVRRRPSRHGDLRIVYEDDRVLVADKPPGLLTVRLRDQPDEVSLRSLVASHWRSHRRPVPFVVHRIDRDTSGLVVFAADAGAWRALKEQFLQREPERHYLAILEGSPEPPEGAWHDWLRWNRVRLRQEAVSRGAERAREAITRYRVIQMPGPASLVHVRLVTGRRHQIRVQASLHGHPLVGERIYRAVGASPLVPFPRQALHATRLVFRHPVTGKSLALESPLPADLDDLLGRLRRDASRAVPPARGSRR